MKNTLAILLGTTVGYMSQNIAASNGYIFVLPFIGLGLIVSFVTYILIGEPHGRER